MSTWNPLPWTHRPRAGIRTTWPISTASRLSVGRIAEALGPIDILVNCAGVGGNTPALEFERAEWRRVLAIDLEAPVFLMQIVARGMVERGYGRIVNVTSVHARLGAVGSVAYDVAKAGLENATRSFGIELAARGVAVNAVAPGFVNTRLADVDADWFRADYTGTGRLPHRRAAEPEEIAAHVAWLASENAGYTSGSVLTVDGAPDRNLLRAAPALVARRMGRRRRESCCCVRPLRAGSRGRGVGTDVELRSTTNGQQQDVLRAGSGRRRSITRAPRQGTG